MSFMDPQEIKGEIQYLSFKRNFKEENSHKACKLIICLWDVEKETEPLLRVQRYTFLVTDPPFEFSRDGEKLIVNSQDKFLAIIDSESLEEETRITIN